MRAPERLIVALVATLVATGVARADEPDPPHREARPRDVLASELADQNAAVDRAIAMVADKVAGAEREKTTRVHAMARALPLLAKDDDPLAAARRVAALRFELGRDDDERAQLVDELGRLRAAKARIADDLTHLATVAIPTALERPAAGPIARHYGVLVHDKTNATLSRRGLDFDVDAHAPATAPARGVVRYAGPIRGLDRGVVIDHGDYYTVIAKLGDLAVPIGASVDAGERVGRAARHRVYLELRVRVGPGGMPIDPEPLLAAPAKKKPARHKE